MPGRRVERVTLHLQHGRRLERVTLHLQHVRIFSA
jgi:hypothetical protein